MAEIVQNVGLAPRHHGFEPCAVRGFDVALFTGNWFAAYSTDSGNSFQSLDPDGLLSNEGESLCCDQRVEFVPSINTFAWVLLSNEGPVAVAVASPDEIRNSGGRHWTYYHVTPALFGFSGSTFDYPQISFGHDYIYLTVNVVGGEGDGRAVIMRMPLGQIAERQTLDVQYITPQHWYICPSHNTRDIGLFATFISDSEIRVYTWAEDPNAWVFHFNVAVATVPTLDFSSLTPDNDDWLPPTSKIDSSITGAARSSRYLYLTWSAGRLYGDGSPSPITQPHVEWVQIDIAARTLVTQRYIWNREFAFAWPSLAANWERDTAIAISLCWGGGRHYPQHAVGTIYPGGNPLLSTTSGRSAGAGGHYNDVRMDYPDSHQFVAAGFNSAKDNASPPNIRNRPHFVIMTP